MLRMEGKVRVSQMRWSQKKRQNGKTTARIYIFQIKKRNNGFVYNKTSLADEIIYV